jgi:hypothetical protein
MVRICFKTENSDPPVCGVHHVPLIRKNVPIDPYAPHLGHITGLICPVTGQVVQD